MAVKERMKIMVSDKLFHIDGWFNLPDTFHGTCGQALFTWEHTCKIKKSTM